MIELGGKMRQTLRFAMFTLEISPSAHPPTPAAAGHKPEEMFAI